MTSNGGSKEDKNTVDQKQEYMNDFGRRLRHLRKLRKKRIDAIAQYIKTHRSTYNSYELGYRLPSLQTIKLLAECLDTSTDYLLFQTDDFDEKESKPDIKKILEDGPLLYGGEPIPEEHRTYLKSVIDSIIDNLDTLDIIIKNKSSK